MSPASNGGKVPGFGVYPGTSVPIKCANCGERTGTVRWGDALSLSHGFYVMWCSICAYTTQLDYARERAAAIPELERQLAEAQSDL